KDPSSEDTIGHIWRDGRGLHECRVPRTNVGARRRVRAHNASKQTPCHLPPSIPLALSPRYETGSAIRVREFLDRVVEGLWRSGPHAGRAHRPTTRHLILAAHSGGGVPLRRLAQVLGDDNAFKDKLKECWGFDSIYGVKDRDAELWSDWSRGHPGTRVTMF